MKKKEIDNLSKNRYLLREQIKKAELNNSSADEISFLKYKLSEVDEQLNNIKSSFIERLPIICTTLINLFGSIFIIGSIVEGGNLNIFDILIIGLMILNFWGFYQMFTSGY